MPKKRVVASCRPQLSPVKSRRASLVRITLHFLGEIGLWLNTRAGVQRQPVLRNTSPALVHAIASDPTFLEHRRLVDLRHAACILVLLVHGGCVQHRVLAFVGVDV